MIKRNSELMSRSGLKVKMSKEIKFETSFRFEFLKCVLGHKNSNETESWAKRAKYEANVIIQDLLK